MDGTESLLARQRKPSRYGGMQITNGKSVHVTLATDLHFSVDGRSLCESDVIPHEHPWVAEATGLLSSDNYISAVKVRGNLPLAVRAAWGRLHMCLLWCLSAARFLGTSCWYAPGLMAQGSPGMYDRLLTLVQSAAGKAGWSCIRACSGRTLYLKILKTVAGCGGTVVMSIACHVGDSGSILLGVALYSVLFPLFYLIKVSLPVEFLLSTGQNGNIKELPHPVSMYNEHMGGVDQKLSTSQGRNPSTNLGRNIFCIDQQGGLLCICPLQQKLSCCRQAITLLFHDNSCGRTLLYKNE